MNEEQKVQSNMAAQEEQINIADLLLILRNNWKWFAASIFVCMALAFVYLKSTPKTYSRKATVLIRDDKKGGGMGESALFADLNLFGGARSVDNELLVFQSRSIMENVVRRLSLNMSYKVRIGLRTIELYTQSPIKVAFLDAEDNQYIHVCVTPLSEKKVRLSELLMIVNNEEIQSVDEPEVALGDTIKTALGNIVVTPTLYYTNEYYGDKIQVQKSVTERVVDDCMTTLSVSLASKMATIIDLEYKDESIARAEDILNTLISVYNEDAINDKNQIAVNTSNFINERLIIIEKELGTVDADIESYKRENQLTDITSETGMYLQTTTKYKQEGLSLENQLSLAEYIKQYLVDPSKIADLIPANTGITDAGVEKQIAEYNEILLKRDKFVTGSSDRNPVVMDLNNSLGAMRQSILRSVDNLIVGININLKNLREQERQTAKRIEAVPTQQKYVLTVERQQATLGNKALVYTNHPGGKNLRWSPNYWAGNEILPRAAQSKNVVICIYNTPANQKNDFSHAYFPVKAFDEVHISGSWIFGRKEDGYVALYSRNTADLRADDRGEVCDLLAKGRQNIWICETGSKSQWGSFSKFIEAISTASVHSDGLDISYESPSEGTVSYGWDSPLYVKGKEMPLRWQYRYDNPYCKTPFNSTCIEIEKDGEKIILNYNKTKR